jgi:hydrogenase expression/formation protein HypE
MHELIDKVFKTAFEDVGLQSTHDSAVLDLDAGRLAMTTDSYVVKPLEFPGGDIGSLAVHGTVNDLSMAGARPRYLSVGFVLEEGLEMEQLWRIVCSMRDAADAAGVRIVTGDTKVVDRGKGDGIYLNTTGVGVVAPGLRVEPSAVEAGDAIVVSGDVGRHGVAVMSHREGLAFEAPIESDSASLAAMVHALLDAGISVRCLRDLTRGGLATCLNEIAASAGRRIEIREDAVPVDEVVRGACEMLGLDPLYVACEGRMVAFVAPEDAARAAEVMCGFAPGEKARVIGEVTENDRALVVGRNAFGTRRVLDLLSGEQLPRIC